MDTVFTEKLYFKKFVYCIKFEFLKNDRWSSLNPECKEIKLYLKTNKIASRTRLDWHFYNKSNPKVILSVYLNDDNTYADLLAKYANFVYWASTPKNKEHKTLLLDNIQTIFRDKLLFNRFMYKVYLTPGWRRENLSEISTWIDNQFTGRKNGRTGDYFVAGSWVITMYLKDESDLTMVRLCLNEHIKEIKKIVVVKDALTTAS